MDPQGPYRDEIERDENEVSKTESSPNDKSL